MASMYGEIIEAKKAILVAVDNSDKDYKAITTAMESKMNGRLDTPLHMAAYALNPFIVMLPQASLPMWKSCPA